MEALVEKFIEAFLTEMMVGVAFKYTDTVVTRVGGWRKAFNRVETTVEHTVEPVFDGFDPHQGLWHYHMKKVDMTGQF
jgi:hypothetical protein